MPRPMRLQHAGAWHHVMNRGSSRQDVFLNDLDRYSFLSLLVDSTRRTDVEVHAYCLMGNHFHLLVRTPKPNLDTAMHLLLSRYVRRFNRRHDRDGPLFRSRFHSLLVQEDQYQLAVSRYIHRNPLDLGVQDLASYPWSSFAAFANRRKAPKWLHTSFTVDQVGGSRAYRAFVQGPFESEVDRMYGGPRAPVALGDEAFLEAVAECDSRPDEMPTGTRHRFAS